MIQKLLFLWGKFKSFASIFFNLRDLVEFFVKLWSFREWVLVGTVLLWIPLLKLAAVLNARFKIKLPFGLPRKHSKVILRTIYWLTVVATSFNLVDKLEHGYDHAKLLVLTICYIFLLIMDYIETEDVINKIDEENGK